MIDLNLVTIELATAIQGALIRASRLELVANANLSNLSAASALDRARSQIAREHAVLDRLLNGTFGETSIENVIRGFDLVAADFAPKKERPATEAPRTFDEIVKQQEAVKTAQAARERALCEHYVKGDASGS